MDDFKLALPPSRRLEPSDRASSLPAAFPASLRPARPAVSPHLSRARTARGTRVAVARVGELPRRPVALLVPETMDEFLRLAAERLRMPAGEVLAHAWNEVGAEVVDAAELLHDELVLVGTAAQADYREEERRAGRCCGLAAALRRVAGARSPSLGRELTGRMMGGVGEAVDDGGAAAAGKAAARRDEKRFFWNHPDFDISRRHLAELFDSFDRERTGCISYEDFRRGLEAANLAIGAEDFDMLVQRVDADKSGNILQHEFVHAIQELTLSARFFARGESAAAAAEDDDEDDAGNGAEDGLDEVFCYDYAPDRYRYRCTAPAGSAGAAAAARAAGGDRSSLLTLDELLSEACGPPEGFAVRWIGLVGRSPQAMLSLARTYDLTQLEIEDAMSEDERIRVVEHAGGRLQIILRVMRARKRPPFRLRDEQVSVFLCGSSTVITVQPGGTDFVAYHVQRRLPYMGSKLRLRGAQYLVHALVDRMVDYAGVLIQRLDRELVAVEREVHSPSVTDPQYFAANVHRLRRQANTMTWWAGPTRNLIEQLGERRPMVGGGGGGGVDDELKGLLDDVGDHLAFIADKIAAVDAWAGSLTEHYRNAQAHRQGEVMYVLTVISAVFMPLGFLSGTFGMNFREMPELEWRYGYALYWVLCLSIAASILGYFRHRRWL